MNDIENKSYKRVCTHHGRFHADEVMATAILKEIFHIELRRTRDPKIFDEMDIVYDVGGGEFDHHGIDKVYRDSGTPYAACGLIWKEFGRAVLEHIDPALTEEEVNSVFEYIDRYLIEGIDAHDNGMRTGEEIIPMMNISNIIAKFNPPWDSGKSEDEAFNEAVDIASIVLQNNIKFKLSVFKARGTIISAYEARTTPQILVLDTFCPWEEALQDIDENEEVHLVVYPNKDRFAMQTIRGNDGKDRIHLPESWAGKENEELAQVTGVEDAVFCHTGRFIAVAKSFEGIMKMAKLAIGGAEESE